MPRASKLTKELAEKNYKTMSGSPLFIHWAKVYLKNKERIEEYEKAYNYVHRQVEDDEQEDS